MKQRQFDRLQETNRRSEWKTGRATFNFPQVMQIFLLGIVTIFRASIKCPHCPRSESIVLPTTATITLATTRQKTSSRIYDINTLTASSRAREPRNIIDWHLEGPIERRVGYAGVWWQVRVEAIKIKCSACSRSRADLSSSRHALIIANILSYIVINRRPIIVIMHKSNTKRFSWHCRCTRARRPMAMWCRR